MANFWRFFASCIFSELVQRVSDLHLKFTLRPHHVSMADIQSVTAEIRHGKKIEEEEETTGQKYNVRICCAVRP